VLTEATGQVTIEVPRDRDGTFEPKLRKKRQRRLNGVEEIVPSLYANGFTTGEISAHFAENYGASVSKETISRITDKVIEEMNEWSARPLDEVYAAIFIDAIASEDPWRASHQQARLCVRIGVTLAGEKDVLGLWAGTGDEGAKFWMSVLTDIKNRGVRDTFFLICDGLKGLPDVVATFGRSPRFRPASSIWFATRSGWPRRRIGTRSNATWSRIYTAPNFNAAKAAFEDLNEKWGKKYGAIIRLWKSAWEEFIPFLDFDLEIRTVICSTNAIESLNARYRRAVRARGHFRTEQAAQKRLYLVTRTLSTRPVVAAPDGRCAGSLLGAHSPSPLPTAGRPRRPTNEIRRKHHYWNRSSPTPWGQDYPPENASG
jgi:putative transposase